MISSCPFISYPSYRNTISLVLSLKLTFKQVSLYLNPPCTGNSSGVIS